MNTQQQQPAGAQPAATPALDNLDKLAAEADATDQIVAEAVTTSEQEQIDARLLAKKKREAAELGAAKAVGFVNALAMMKNPILAMTQEERQMLEAPLAEYMLKHDGEPPEWYVENKELFDLLGAAAVVGFGMYARVKLAEVHEQQRQQHQKSQGDQQQAQPPPAHVAPPVQMVRRDDLDPNSPMRS